MLAAGLEGIEKKYELPPPVETNVYGMSESQREELGIELLPRNLWEAIQITQDSELVKNALGEQVFNSFINNKMVEWEQYHSNVADHEVTRYLPLL